MEKLILDTSFTSSKWNYRWNEINLIPQLMVGNYPLLVGPSQSGKTTRVMKLVEQLQSKYLAIYISTGLLQQW
jgi:RecA-family ATPase